MKAYWGSGGTANSLFDLDTRWRRVVSFTPRPLYRQLKIPWYSLDRSLSGSQSRFRRGDVLLYICKVRLYVYILWECTKSPIQPSKFWSSVYRLSFCT